MKSMLWIFTFTLLSAGVRADEPMPKADAAKLPAAFDLRSVKGVTPVKAQQGGTCWAHGAMAAIESNMLVTGAWKKFVGDGQPAFSEYHLDWWNGFNKHLNEDLKDAAKDPSGLKVHVGGDYRVTAAYIARGEGLVAIPGRQDRGKEFYSKTPKRQDPEDKRFYVRDIEWLTVGDKLETIDVMKRRITTEGGLGTAYTVSKNFIGKDFIHYQPATSKSQPNHAVAIVGWDDAKITADPMKQPPGPGAWLIKNSWGTSKGQGGYYWISYHDKWCGRHFEMGAVSFRNVVPMRYAHVYHHDYHGWRDELPKINKAFNAFAAADDHALEAVSFYTTKPNVDCVLKIYGGFDKTQLLDERRTVKATYAHPGLHTLDLDRPLDVKKGEKFYVQLEVSAGGQAIDRTSEIPVLLGQPDPKPKAQPDPKPEPKVEPKPQTQPKAPTAGRGPNGPVVISKAQPGESYYWDGSAWKDLYEHRFQNPTWATFDRTANFCMKALAVRPPGGAPASQE